MEIKMRNNLGNKEILAKNLASFMKQKGVDRYQLAKDLNFPYTTITDWLKGKTYPRIDKIELMARYFRCEKSDLIESHDSQPDIMTENEIQFVDLFRELNTEGQEKTIEYIQFLLEKNYKKNNKSEVV